MRSGFCGAGGQACLGCGFRRHDLRRGGAGRGLFQPVTMAQGVDRRPVEQVVPVGVGAVAGFRHQGRGAHALEQRDDVGNRMVAVQRGAADVAVARASDQRDPVSSRLGSQTATRWPATTPRAARSGQGIGPTCSISAR